MPHNEINENPDSDAVAEVYDSQRVYQDVDRKMRLYSVITALKSGLLPSNDQIQQTLKYASSHAPFDINVLSDDGKILVNDTRAVFNTANDIVQQKNKDERLQQFLYKTRDKKHVSEKANLDKSTFPKGSKEGNDKALHHLRTIFTLIATNSEIRKLLTDSKILGFDLFADAAANAANMARPPAEQINKLDETAPEGWKNNDGSIVGADQTPQYNLPKLKKGKKAAEEGHDNAENVKKAALEREKDSITRAQNSSVKVDQSDGDLQQGVQNALEEQNPEGMTQSQNRSTIEGNEKNIPPQHRDKAQDSFNRTKKHLEEIFPEERRASYINRLKKVVYENQKHKDWKEAFEFFFAEFEIYKGGLMKAGGGEQQAASSILSDPEFRSAAEDLRVVLERFANNNSASPIFESFDRFIKMAVNDKQKSEWLDHFVAYVRRIFLEPGYVLSEEVIRDGERIGETARTIFTSKYKAQIKNELFATIADFFIAMGKDPLNKKLGSDINKLFRDLFFNESGKWTFKSELWADVRDKIVPPVVEQIGAVPIPRIEYSDPAIDVVIENLVLQGKNLLPNYITFEAYNQLKFSPYDTTSNEHHHDIEIELGQIQCDLRDIAFYINRHKGFPKLNDAGLADVFLGGKGVSVTVMLRVDSDNENIFTVKSVKASVGKLKFKIRDSKHDLLYKTVKPLLMSLIRKQITKAIEDGTRSGLTTLNNKLVEIRREMEATKEARKEEATSEVKGGKKGETSRTSIISDKFRGKKESSESAADGPIGATQNPPTQSHFRVVANRNSQLIDAGHSQGWINLQAKYENKVGEGDTWHSKAFSVV
ncbi:hypothetical protein J056_003212 [Wallemia ichthyophaga EXF-994]|uniref:Uncharacterized protein n=1 Tax=Wallemia ichthyophaga (strain EXF-994 / CBS 113033) TaxID=1299270 RepID=R9A998_WALI9|nr:uncharacterized protein J056_003212 [Wallemia ichthyophaga EXF-994]EOQ98692.1 hypothetical protein J056_003212 [Wallemia ichthyophaga EXF-994]